MVVLGIGNVLQKDDGMGVYAATWLEQNYRFSPEVKIINGGVEGINLYSVFEENDSILILDSIDLEDDPGSIYLIPSNELGGRGLNSGGAHEIGVLQCLDMLELQGKAIPKAAILGIVPEHVTFEMALSDTLSQAFEGYIRVAVDYLAKEEITAVRKERPTSLQEIIDAVKRV